MASLLRHYTYIWNVYVPNSVCIDHQVPICPEWFMFGIVIRNIWVPKATEGMGSTSEWADWRTSTAPSNEGTPECRCGLGLMHLLCGSKPFNPIRPHLCLGEIPWPFPCFLDVGAARETFYCISQRRGQDQITGLPMWNMHLYPCSGFQGCRLI